MNVNTTNHLDLIDAAATFIIKEMAMIDSATVKSITDMAGRINLHDFEEEANSFSGILSQPSNQAIRNFLCSTASLLKMFLDPEWTDLEATLTRSGINTGLVIAVPGEDAHTIAVNPPNVSFKAKVIQQCQWIIPLILIRLNAQVIADAFEAAKPDTTKSVAKR